MRRPGAAHSVAWKYHEREIQLVGESRGRLVVGVRRLKWSEHEFTDRKVCGSNPTSVYRLLLSALGQHSSIPSLVLPSGGMAARHRKGVTSERLVDNLNQDE
ncbi:hypothetical protein CSKR_107986 [Clonorchis sinensis]|uniref:Uncharacterized protein n=1 Tax=Clonorchis sinensis TaxID=79923 RepID=A0A3R7G2I1_CLOSI|nr:hypothetical protein CSKR_107986 [Clonorchis sinensis]